MNKRHLFLAAFLVIVSFSCLSQTYSWKQRANYGGGEIFNPLWMVISGKAYVGTGLSVPGTLRNDFWQYDPQTDVWTQKANVPGNSRYGAVGFSILNYGFAGSGWTPSPTNDFHRYDTFLNQWTSIAPFPGQARYTATSFTIGSYGFVGLGYSPCRSDFWRYDPILNTWSQTASFPGGARQSVVSFVIDNYAYVGTGLCNGTLYKDFYKYDLIANSWTPIADLPTNGRTAGFGFALNGFGYYLMGCDYQNSSQPYSLYNDVWQYDPLADSWTQLTNFPGSKSFHGVAFNIGSKGYVGLGTDTTAFSTSYLSDFWEYSIDTLSSLSDSQSSSQVSVYPIPARDFVTISFSADVDFDFNKFSVQNSAGQLIKVVISSITINSIRLDISGIDKGVYYISFGNHNKHKFLKV